MPLLTTLLFAADPEQRLALAHGLIQRGHEVVTARSLEEALLYLDNMPFSAVVLPSGGWLTEPPPLLERLLSGKAGDQSPNLVVLGSDPEHEADLRRNVIFLPVWDIEQDELLLRLRLVLLGGFLNLPPDETGGHLVGSIAQRPFLDLVPALAKSGESCRIDLEGAGTCWCHNRQVVAARAGRAQGEKAFYRLARRLEGAFHVALEEATEAQIQSDVDTLVQQAVIDSLGDRPDPRSRASLNMGPNFFSGSFDASDQMLLTLAKDGADMAQLLDALPESDSEVVDRILQLVDAEVLELQPPTRRVAVVTDSTSDLPKQEARELWVDVVPLTVHFGAQVYLDRAELTPKGFYDLLQSSADHPASQPPSTETFGKLFRRLQQDGDVVSIHISGELSETYEHARTAAEAIAKEAGVEEAGTETTGVEEAGVANHQIEVIDSRQVSLGLGLVTKFASRLAAKGIPLDELARRVRDLARRTHVLFAVHSLEYLERGGRIGKLQAFFGSLMRVKPILGIVDGKIVPIDRVRGGRLVQGKLLELALERVDAGATLMGSVAHANAPQWADRLHQLLASNLKFSELDVIEIGPVVGTHTGPGTVGVAFCALTEDEIELLRS